jgi:hypothetical protein
MKKGWLVGLALLPMVGLVWIVFSGAPKGKAPVKPIATQSPPETAPPPPKPAPSVVNVPQKTLASANAAMPSAEPMDVKTLQELLEKDPEAALKTARRDLARDPNGPDAAERNWVIVKSVAVLGRYEEARREAEIMVPKFQGTRWADDVERHLLVHP